MNSPRWFLFFMGVAFGALLFVQCACMEPAPAPEDLRVGPVHDWTVGPG